MKGVADSEKKSSWVVQGLTLSTLLPKLLPPGYDKPCHLVQTTLSTAQAKDPNYKDTGTNCTLIHKLFSSTVVNGNALGVNQRRI